MRSLQACAANLNGLDTLATKLRHFDSGQGWIWRRRRTTPHRLWPEVWWRRLAEVLGVSFFVLVVACVTIGIAMGTR